MSFARVKNMNPMPKPALYGGNGPVIILAEDIIDIN